ncbi:uncharacterized protein LOC126678348 [Mercurialis annua]|uniref:uncharacterized protein LOC126678348 n=1 Tax=Mercurialis annua TaxID=3986 RepID=UPI0021605110|nr:uncharacterized protein LOC126678348 [Mercurialis annua]
MWDNGMQLGLFSAEILRLLTQALDKEVDKSYLWSNILQELQSERQCFLMGDFNKILHSDESTSRSKIDRCFISPPIYSTWPHLILKALPRSYSDHVPVMFNSAVGLDWGPNPFKSINSWWNDPSFYDLIRDSWATIKINHPGADLVTKLRELRIIIKAWNKNSFGNINTKFESVQAEINALEADMDLGENSDFNKSRWEVVHTDYSMISEQIESLWHHKSRLNWNLYGNKNTNFFHTIALVHSRTSLFLKNKQLIRVFSEGEIFAALSDCDDNKAPGPDGFNFFFYKRVWSIIKNDFLDYFRLSFSSGFFPPGLNTTFPVLIPKLKGASYVKHFRPISLINGVFKLLSKVLTNKLSLILPLII